MEKYNGEKQKKQREEDKKKQDEEKEDGGWKGWKNGDDVKDGNEEYLEDQIFLVLFFVNKSRKIYPEICLFRVFKYLKKLTWNNSILSFISVDLFITDSTIIE